MSAYIVTPSTINAIVTFAYAKRMYVDTLPCSTQVGSTQPIDIYEPQQIAETLWTENHRSVNARYRTNTVPPPFRYAPTRTGKVTPTQTRTLTALDIISLCKCLNYQSCETDDWSDTWACRFLLDVIARAADDVLDGKDVPWGLYD